MNLHPVLKEYISRFNFSNNQNPENYSFFTQLSLSEYQSKLPYLFNIENFCYRLYLASQNSEKICIYSDYDTDAVTATATMYWGLINAGFKKENLNFYAPDRLTEGYGLNIKAIDNLSKKYSLIITVDCGINSTEEAIICQKNNCDLMITDHHQLKENIPEALAVINPVLGIIYQNNSNLFKKNIFSKKSQNYNFYKGFLANLKIRQTDSKNFLSTKVTGVGVAWFCIVWLTYFFEEIKVFSQKIDQK